MPLELAIAKAERERQRSQRLAIYARSAAQRALQRGAVRRDQALDEGRLLRGKLMAAARGVGRRVPCPLRPHARSAGGCPAWPRNAGDPEDREAAPAAPAEGRARPAAPHAAEIELLLCAVRAIGGEPEAARLARAHVTAAERANPANTLALAVCAAALDERDAALPNARALRFTPRRRPPRPGYPARRLSMERLGPPARRPPVRKPLPPLTARLSRTGYAGRLTSARLTAS